MAASSCRASAVLIFVACLPAAVSYCPAGWSPAAAWPSARPRVHSSRAGAALHLPAWPRPRRADWGEGVDALARPSAGASLRAGPAGDRDTGSPARPELGGWAAWGPTGGEAGFDADAVRTTAPEDSTVTLQRLAAALKEEGSSIEASEDAKNGGRRRQLFRPRQVPGTKIPNYGRVRVIEPTRRQTATIIWFHDAPPGSHSSARRWERRLRAMDLGWCRIIIPSGFASERPRSTLSRLVRPGKQLVWYEEGSDYGLAASLQYLQAVVAQEVKRGIAPDRIMLAGAGQGADLAVLGGLLLSARLGGVVALDAHIPRTIALLPSPESAATPFLCWTPPHAVPETSDTLRALAGPPRPIESAPEIGGWVSRSLGRLRR
jgi:predicted esterase